ncbi:50S ribosomal protein L3 [Elysia marginata]|uniref:Large ribosomal subunit protein uL3c n=1 Tax=Elysia marginata TaxID=1093978 RepID=A0AAV4FSB1_9GAST|nr:50S ribosomal protein L3 [Elysia marginata]
MDGFTLGQTVDASIFSAGQLVDVTGTAKGKGFAGAIKRHNQSIGPKSHGGGGGSKPVRQTGSLGDISGNKVVKGMTMPGQMGNVQRTQQNLEVISVDPENNLLLIKGSIPGPKKSYVIVKEAIKLLPDKEVKVLVNVKEAQEKNELLEEAKKAGADVNTDMSVQEMKDAIKASSEAKEQEKAAAKAKEEAEKAAAEKDKVEAAASKAKEAVEAKTASGDSDGAKEAQAKADALDKQVEVAKAKADEVKDEAKKVESEAKEAQTKAEELQVKTEEDTPEPEAKEKSEDKEEDK